MKTETLLKVLNNQVALCMSRLCAKNNEYGNESDALYHFTRAAELHKTSSEDIALKYATKHLISVISLVEQSTRNEMLYKSFVDEKMGDLVCYLLLIWAMLSDKAVDDYV